MSSLPLPDKLGWGLLSLGVFLATQSPKISAIASLSGLALLLGSFLFRVGKRLIHSFSSSGPSEG